MIPVVSLDAADQRHRRLVAAAVRGAYSWSHRARHPKAMREIARMTGVVMEAIGPGRGPTAPMALVACLRRPLGELMELVGLGDEAVADAVLLDDHGALNSVAYDIASEYAHQLNDPMDGGSWLPTWTRMRSDQIAQSLFARLVESGRQGDYVRARRFLVDHPAGDRMELSRLVAAGARCAAEYHDVPAGQRWEVNGKQWWWPCPRCRWPMTVTEGLVRCSYGPHHASYRVSSPSATRSAPRLLRTREDGPRPPRAQAADRAVCVDQAAWRSVVVPGATEVRIAIDLERLGATVSLWPEMDAYDLHVTVGAHVWRFDVKEYRSLRRLIADLREKPPAAAVLLPKTHEHQRDALVAALPSLRIAAETDARRSIRQAVREAR